MVHLPTDLSIERTEKSLLSLAALFMVTFGVALSLSPAARTRSWDVDYRWGHWLGVSIWLAGVILIHLLANRWLPQRDPFLFPAASLLSGWGLMSIWRLAPEIGLRQSLWLAACVIIVVLGLRLPKDLEFLRRYKYLWLTGGLFLTGLTLILGTNPLGYGPRLWLGCCGLYFQPSEPLKLLLVIYLAAYLAERVTPAQSAHKVALLPVLAPTLVMTGLAMALLLVQRDLGTASIFIFLYILVVFSATGDWRILAFGCITLILAGVTGYALFDVVRLRVDAWINPWLDPSGRSYQIVQSLLAVANGGLIGRGPGMGNPTLVPVSYSDFIFAAIAEEQGLLGAIALISGLALFAIRGLRIALHAPDAFQRYLATGLIAHIAGQATLIIGGNLRLLPLTGVTLPFVSYGGSSLVTSFLILLILEHISSQEERQPAPLHQRTAFMTTGAILMAGLVAAGLAAGWWAYQRGPDLLSRNDNARRAIADRFVLRGKILDRSNTPISMSIGKPGVYERRIIYPDLSPVIGYSNPVYGQSGLESGMDETLRGLSGNPGLTIWWNYMLYGQPPPGLSVRLTLDINLQRGADLALGDQKGALVLLDARSGEILAMASHPSFDANRLEQIWEHLITDPNSPLVNRATQGSYPLGSLGTLLLPRGMETPGLEQFSNLYLPVIEIPTLREGLWLSPLQAALSAAALSNAGIRPEPVLVQAIDAPITGWVIMPAAGNPARLYSADEVDKLVLDRRVEDLLIWETSTVASDDQGGEVTWYLGGTLPTWNGTPLSIAVVIENSDLALSKQIGRLALKAAMAP